MFVGVCVRVFVWVGAFACLCICVDAHAPVASDLQEQENCRLSYEELYRYAYQMVYNKKEAQLYEGVAGNPPSPQSPDP
jgi:hypothetical protein